MRVDRESFSLSTPELMRLNAEKFLMLQLDVMHDRLKMVTNIPASVRSREVLTDIFLSEGGRFLDIDAPYPKRRVSRAAKMARIKAGVG